MWKWAVALALLACSVFLFLWKPAPRPVKVELLTFTDSPPAWDGSYPYVVISSISGSIPVKFKTSISLMRPTARHDSPVNDFLVDLHTGRFVLRQTDLFVPDVMPLSLTRTYIVWDYHSRAFGVGGNHPYDICPTGTRNPYTYMDLNLEDDRSIHMRRISKGAGYADAVFRHAETSSEFYGAQVAWNGNGWTLDFRDGRKFFFPEAYAATNRAQGAPIAMVDADGHRIQLKRSKVRNLEELLSPGGHTIRFKYDLGDRIVEADDDTGQIRKYTYDQGGHLDTVSDGAHILYRFEYQRLMNEAGYDPWLLTAILDGDWNVLLRNKFLWGRVSEQKLGDGEVYRYEYRLQGSNVLQTTVTQPSGEKKVFNFQEGILVKESKE
jgi:YD repeat-containing protein